MKAVLISLLVSFQIFAADAVKKPVVVIETNFGNIEVELNPEKAPVTVENFLKYVDDKFYNGTIFHRVINGFMIQGGGFTEDMKQKSTRDPIKLESQNGLSNDTATIAMARTMNPNSATAQFFINVNDNNSLNYSPNSDGYAVFGRVTNGMTVVNKIKMVKTHNFQGMADVPVDNVVIKSIKRK